MRTKKNEIAFHSAIVVGLSCIAVGCLDLSSPACADLPSANVLFVDGRTGSDNGTGECAAPFKTITKALSVANTSSAQVVHILGNADPVVYGTATTGERFPLQIVKNGLTLEGDGETKVIVRGGGPCVPIDETEDCAVAVSGADVTIRGLQVENITGHGIRTTSSVVKLEDIVATNCGAAGILLGSEVSRLNRVVASSNTNDGVRIFRPAGMPFSLFLDECTSTNNGRRGFYAQNDGTITSTKTIYSNNAWSGMTLEDNVELTSNGDTFENNADGITTVSNSVGVKIDVRNALSQSNKGNGFNIVQADSFKLHDSTVIGNGESGVSMAIAGERVDLGSATESGNNTLQSTAKPNKTGICFNGTGTLLAQGNHFSACPQTSNPDGSCTSGVDVGGSTMMVLDGCIAP